MTRFPQAAHYGLGNVFPVIVLDGPGWTMDSPAGPPERDAASPDVLVLRWCAPTDEHAVSELLRAAARAPDHPTAEHLTQYRDDLPPGIRLITLRPTALLGSWADRPGRHHTPQHRHAPNGEA
ncbi:hypothetical protein ACIOG4_28760 [Streptomyces microflavus]|uniref:hypothetical protein n=1 Tax=Streptomyces microflavus TaxID=1919 RepID=UPI0038162C47